MFIQLVKIIVLILSQSKPSTQRLHERNELEGNPELHNLCHPDLELTIQDCCLQPAVQRSCKYCQEVVFSCNSVNEKFNQMPVAEVSQFQKEAGVLNPGEDRGDNIFQHITSYESSDTEPKTVMSNKVHDQMKRSTSSRAKHLSRVKPESQIFSNVHIPKDSSSLSKRNIIHEIKQLKQFQPLHKEFQSSQDKQSSPRKFNDKNRMYPIGYLNKLRNKDKNVNLELSFDIEQYPQAVDEVMKTDNIGTKSAPIVMNLPVYRESKEYTSRLINDSHRRRQFLSDLHNFRKEKNKLEVQRDCDKSSGHESIITSGCIDDKPNNPFTAGDQAMIKAGVELQDTNDDRKEPQFKPSMAADDRMSESVQSDNKLVKRWGSLGAGKFRRWWFGN